MLRLLRRRCTAAAGQVWHASVPGRPVRTASGAGAFKLSRAWPESPSVGRWTRIRVHGDPLGPKRPSRHGNPGPTLTMTRPATVTHRYCVTGQYHRKSEADLRHWPGQGPPRASRNQASFTWNRVITVALPLLALCPIQGRPAVPAPRRRTVLSLALLRARAGAWPPLAGPGQGRSAAPNRVRRRRPESAGTLLPSPPAPRRREKAVSAAAEQAAQDASPAPPSQGPESLSPMRGGRVFASVPPSARLAGRPGLCGSRRMPQARALAAGLSRCGADTLSHGGRH
jgi:hypothetical protein